MKYYRMHFSTLILCIFLCTVIWLFYSYFTKNGIATDNVKYVHSEVYNSNLEISLKQFLGDPSLQQLVQSCLPIYNDQFRKINPQHKELTDLVTFKNFTEDELVYFNSRTGKKHINFASINLINEFFNVLNSPMSDHQIINECFIEKGYTFQDMERIQIKFGHLASFN